MTSRSMARPRSIATLANIGLGFYMRLIVHKSTKFVLFSQLLDAFQTHREFLATTLAAAFFLFLAGSGNMQAQTATVNWTNVHQVIDGFGASNENMGGSASSANQSLLFGTGSGHLGLSLLRVGVTDGSQEPGDCTSVSASCAGIYVSDMQAVTANGGKVI